jgi:hypothetical protein
MNLQGWPLATVILVLAAYVLFRKQIAEGFSRLKEVAFPGGKVTLSQELDVAKASADAAEAETEAEGTGTSRDAERNRFENLVTANPVQALIELRRMITEAIQLFAKTFDFNDIARMPLTHAIAALEDRGYLTPTAATSITHFVIVSDRVSLPGVPPSDSDVRKAIEIGWTVYRAIPTVAPAKHFVVESGATLYSMSECLPVNVWAGIKGVAIRSVQPGLPDKLRWFPTSSQYTPGERVSFEVDAVNHYGDAWFRDSNSGEIKVAWNKQTPLFQGRAIGDTKG